MNRFFYSAEQKDGDNVVLIGKDAHHLVHVLRSAVDDQVDLCDAHGVCQRAVITAVNKNDVICQLGDVLVDGEAQVKVYLAFGLLKGEKTDLVLQKATELGVAGFYPFMSQRTVARPEKKMDNRLQRWDKIIRSAAAQSRRSVIPTVAPPCSWSQLLTQFSSFRNVILFWENEVDSALASALQSCMPGDKILLITGSEGGLSEKEALSAKEHGADVVTLGSRILRAETAAITAVAVSLYQVGEMGGV